MIPAGWIQQANELKRVFWRAVTPKVATVAMWHPTTPPPSGVKHDRVIEIYNAFNKFNLGNDVGPYMMSKVNAGDAKAAYQALMDFKDVVKASQR